MHAVLVAHGSRDPRFAATARQVRDAVRRADPTIHVELAYLDLDEPSVPDVLARLDGDVAIVPLLLGDAFHNRVDLPALLADAAPPDWEADLRQTVVPGGMSFREVGFFHGPSRTLILTDLVLNLEPAKMPALLRPLLKLARMTTPHGQPPPYLRLVVKLRRQAAARAAAELVALKPERVIFAHGLWFAGDATARLRHALRWLGRFT